MNLRHLRAFEASARLGSLNMAASETLMSQSSVSYAISAVEAFFGHELLVRGPQGCVATADGGIVLARSRSAFERIERAVRSLVGTGETRDPRQIAKAVVAQQIDAVTTLTRLQVALSASRDLAITEATLLRRVRDLEKLMGRSFFQRSDGRFFVTDLARDAVRDLSLAQRELDFARTELLLTKPSGKAVIAVGCVGPARSALMPRAIGAFNAEYPNATLRISHESFDILHARLLSGDVDVLIGTERIDLEHSALDRQFLFRNSYILACRKDHPLARQRSVELADLAAYGWIVPIGGKPLRDAIDRSFSELGARPHIVLETPSISTSWAVMLDSDHIMVSPSAAIEACHLEGQVHVLPYQIAGDMGRVMLYTRSDLQMPQPQNDFVKVILAFAEQLRQREAMRGAMDFEEALPSHRHVRVA
jgi:LysR family transcriptional regulator of gallate degradation